MSSTSFICIVCSKNLKSDDEIVATQCGHAFHGICLKKRNKESPQCPQCLMEIRNTIRVYLNAESAGTSQTHQITELRAEISHLYKTQMSLKSDLDVSKREIQTLKDELTKKNKEIIEKNKQLERTDPQIKAWQNELDKKTIELYNLKELMNKGKSSTLSNALQEEINVLQEKNRQISQELAKEIRNSDQLLLEKQRLESLIKQLKLNLAQKSSADDFQNKNDNFDKLSEKSGTDEFDVQSVVIRNIKEKFADYDEIRKYVYKLTDLMELYYTGDDILNVYTLNRNEEKISLVVKFKTLQMKTMFLSKKNKLKENTSTKDIFLYEFVNNETHLLFHQARSLRSLGFKHVYCRNNVVFVKRENGSAAITIKNTDDIEKLKAENAL